VPSVGALRFRCGIPSKALVLPRDDRPCRKVSYSIGWLAGVYCGFVPISDFAHAQFGSVSPTRVTAG